MLVAAGVALALAQPAQAYVRSRADSGIPKYWQKSCIPVTVYQNGFADMSRDEVAKSIAAAAHTWSPTAVTCPDGVSHPFVEIVTSIAPEGELPPTPAYDGRNTLLFYTYDRPYPPPEVSGISLNVIALTSTWARADGHIVDADVRVNAKDNFFANLDPGSTAGNGQLPFDLQNAITHEFGHLIGLGHTCWSPFSDPEQPVDDQGVPGAVLQRRARRAAPDGDVRDHRRQPGDHEAHAVGRRHPGGVRHLSRRTGPPRLHARHARGRLRLQRRRDRAATVDGPGAARGRRRRPRHVPSSSTRTSRIDASPRFELGGTSSSCSALRKPAATTVSRQWPGTRRSSRNVPSRLTSALAFAPPGPIASRRPRATAAPVVFAFTSPAIPPGNGTVRFAYVPGVAS